MAENNNLIQELDSFVSRLLRYNLEAVAIPGDGNCFFRSVSHHQLYGDQNYHLDIRHTCVEYVRGTKHCFAHLPKHDIHGNNI